MCAPLDGMGWQEPSEPPAGTASGDTGPPQGMLHRLVQLGCVSSRLPPMPPARPPQIDLVLMPATTGDFGVMPGHVPTVAQLRCAGAACCALLLVLASRCCPSSARPAAFAGLCAGVVCGRCVFKALRGAPWLPACRAWRQCTQELKSSAAACSPPCANSSTSLQQLISTSLDHCRPGVVTVHKELDKSVEKYFVSGGFAFVHPDSTADICAVRRGAVCAGVVAHGWLLGRQQLRRWLVAMPGWDGPHAPQQVGQQTHA